MSKPQKKPRGRPPKGDRTMRQIAIRVGEDQLEAVDRVIEARLGAPDRASVIRELLSIGIKHCRDAA